MKSLNLTICYYALIVTALVSQAIFTVYQGSVVIGNGQRMTQIEREKSQLVEQSRALKQTLAAQSSLLHISQAPLYNEFVPVQKTLVVTTLTTVASR